MMALCFAGYLLTAREMAGGKRAVVLAALLLLVSQTSHEKVNLFEVLPLAALVVAALALEWRPRIALAGVTALLLVVAMRSLAMQRWQLHRPLPRPP